MENMKMVYQPIVKLSNGEVVGYEALARFPRPQEDGHQPLEPADPPDQVFKRAWEEGNGYGLEIMAVDLALRGFIKSRARANGLYLSINTSVKTIARLPPSLADISPNEDIPWDQLVVEITEHDSIDDLLPLHQALYYLRKRKVRLALDDVGVGNSGLSRIFQLKPNILKTDRTMTSGIDTLPYPRANILHALADLAIQDSMSIVAEGIENEAERRWCEMLGIDFGQGYLFGRPGPLEQVPDAA